MSNHAEKDAVRWCHLILALGLNLLDPVSCRGLFALVALARRRAGTGTHTAYLYCNLLRGSLDGRTDDPTDDPPVYHWQQRCA